MVIDVKQMYSRGADSRGHRVNEIARANTYNSKDTLIKPMQIPQVIKIIGIANVNPTV